MFGRLFFCSTFCVTWNHAIIKAIIRFGTNSLLSTSFMRINSNKSHCEVLSEGALFGCLLLTGVSLQFWASMRDNIFYFCNPLWEKTTVMCFVHAHEFYWVTIYFCEREIVGWGYFVSRVRLAKLHFISRIVVLIALMHCARKFVSARFELFCVGCVSPAIRSIAPRRRLHSCHPLSSKQRFNIHVDEFRQAVSCGFERATAAWMFFFDYVTLTMRCLAWNTLPWWPRLLVWQTANCFLHASEFR